MRAPAAWAQLAIDQVVAAARSDDEVRRGLTDRFARLALDLQLETLAAAARRCQERRHALKPIESRGAAACIDAIADFALNVREAATSYVMQPEKA